MEPCRLPQPRAHRDMIRLQDLNATPTQVFAALSFDRGSMKIRYAKIRHSEIRRTAFAAIAAAFSVIAVTLPLSAPGPAAQAANPKPKPHRRWAITVQDPFAPAGPTLPPLWLRRPV